MVNPSNELYQGLIREESNQASVVINLSVFLQGPFVKIKRRNLKFRFYLYNKLFKQMEKHGQLA